MHRSVRSLFFLASFLLAPIPSPAAFGPSHVKADLLSEAERIAPGEPFWVALRLRMDGKWHTYWRNPGESGMPTKITWSLPPGFSAGPIQWPHPERIEVPPVVSFGYGHETALLVQITPPKTLAPGPVALAAKVEWLECDVTCIPGEAKLALNVPAAERSATDPKTAEFFSKARAKIPLAKTDWTFKAALGDGFVRLSAVPPAGAESVSGLEFFPDDPLVFGYARQEWRKTAAGYETDLARSDLSTAPVTAVSGVLVSKEGWRGRGSERAVEIRAPVEGRAAPAPAPAAAVGLLAALGLSFLGGLLLNLMPCVLPVLSIKVLSLVESAGESRVRNALAYAAGVLVAFWALAASLLALRAGGEQLGWGFQLQSPPVVAALASLFFLMALNLFGVFEIGVGLTRFGGGRRSGLGGAFSSGLLATVVATPCTAPFMGSALGFALTRPAPEALAVFSSLGLGMALPFVALAASPALLRFVPKPGAWMETMKNVLGFLLAATVVWLAWVLGRQAGAEAIVLLLGGLLIQSVGAWVYGRWTQPRRSAGVRAAAVAAALLLVGGGAAAAIVLSNPAAPASASGIDWEPYSEARVEAERAAGKPVFVDFTAAWCLTCQVNERVALGKPEVVAKLKEKGIVPLKADWTSRDPAITAALGKLGRSGVPVYALYSSNPAEPPRLLNEILTPSLLVAAFDETK